MRPLLRPLHRLWQIRSSAYRALDRPLLRTALARVATWAARRETDADIDFFFREGLWMFRVDDTCLPGEAHFVYRHGNELQRWPDEQRRLAEDIWLYVYAPKPGDVVVDVGAGIGGETQLFAERVGPTGRVLSVEANPTTFRRLDARVRWNRLDNVTTCHCAIVDRARGVYVEDRQEVYERNTVSLERRERDLPLPVEGVSLDELCDREGIARIDFLKMNIEGAERLAIEGMKKIVAETQMVCIACHDFLGEDVEHRAGKQVAVFLERAGFRIVRRDDDPRSFVRDLVYARRP